MFFLKGRLLFTSIIKHNVFKNKSWLNRLARIVIVVFSITTANSFAQSETCDTSDPFCTDDVMIFPAGVNTGDAEEGPNYGCLLSQHNPAWYHMLIASPGDLILEISSTPAYDIDFICWGPFTDPQTPCNGQLTSSAIVDCSYAGGSAPEICNILNTQVGEYYILLITNWSNNECSITFSKTGGNGETDCNIVPGAASNNSPICEGETLELYAESVNNATYYWTGPGGFTSNQQNPFITNAQLANAGTYYLTVTLGGNSSQPYATDAIVNALPNALFSNNTVCAGEETIFTDLSTCSTPATPVDTWLWDFGDGNTSNEQNPVHQYAITNDISYDVMLKVTTTGGCLDSIVQTIQVLGSPVSDFSYQFVDGIPCLGSNIQFTDLSSTINGIIESWNWNFGDGNTSDEQNPLHNFSSNGTFMVSLIVVNTGGCDSTIFRQVAVYSAPIIDFSYTEVCLGLPTYFDDASFINIAATATWLYDFDDGNTASQSNPIHTYTNAGDYNVQFSIVDTNGCSNNVSHLLSVFESPIAEFAFDTVCQFFPTTFTDETTPLDASENWNWDFGDSESSIIQNPTHIYDTSGIYQVTLIVGSDNSCQDTLTKDIWVWQPPIANFLSSDTSCTTGLFFFNDSSYSLESNVIDYLWNFPDGHISYNPNTYFVFLSPETNYPVSLMITDERGCMDTITNNIYVKPELQMNFHSDTVCFGDETMLSAYIVKPQDDSIVQYTWFFNDGGAQVTTPDTIVFHEFLDYGVFEVKLQATNINGCTDIFRKSVRIRENPISNFNFQESFCYDSTTFSDLSIGNEGNIDYWKWEYDDGEYLEVNNPNNPDNYHFYPPNHHTYNASLFVSDEYGCIDSVFKEIIHYPCVLVEFYNDTSWICENTAAVFIDSTLVDADFDISEKTWHFGDGNFMSVSPDTDTVIYQYQNHGEYEVKLIIGYDGDNLHFTDSILNSIQILAVPNLSFFSTSVCLGESTEISNLSFIDESQIEQVYWRYGDGIDTTYLYNANYTQHEHSYESDGNFPLFLHLKANNNCEDSMTNNVIVHPLPEIGFVADSTIFCGNATVFFTDTSHINSGIIAQRLWTFGDGDFLSSSEDTASHLYESGIYSVRLENTSDQYCKSNLLLEDYIFINPVVEAEFAIDPEIVSIHGTSNLEIINYVSDESYFRWTLSDTILWENLYTPNIADSIFDTGTYELKMYTINEFGCIDSSSRYFEVTPVYSFYVPTGFSPNGNGTNDYFGPAGKYFDMTSYSFRVFNRWGEMVFHTNDFYEHWDGKTTKGEIAPMDTYAWIIQLVDMDGNHKVIRGAITLLL